MRVEPPGEEHRRRSRSGVNAPRRSGPALLAWGRRLHQLDHHIVGADEEGDLERFTHGVGDGPDVFAKLEALGFQFGDRGVAQGDPDEGARPGEVGVDLALRDVGELLQLTVI